MPLNLQPTQAGKAQGKNTEQQLEYLSPTATEVICWPCRPATSCACRPLRRSQKRSVPSKWPEATSEPSAVMARELQLEWHMRVRRQ